jgi:hypothetical protein
MRIALHSAPSRSNIEHADTDSSGIHIAMDRPRTDESNFNQANAHTNNNIIINIVPGTT